MKFERIPSSTWGLDRLTMAPVNYSLSRNIWVLNQIFSFQDRGIDGTIFQKPSKLHLTIGILTLACQAEIEQAQEVLQKCHDKLVRYLCQSHYCCSSDDLLRDPKQLCHTFDTHYIT